MQLISTLAHEIMCEPYQSYHHLKAVFDYLDTPYSFSSHITGRNSADTLWSDWVSKGRLQEYIELFIEKT